MLNKRWGRIQIWILVMMMILEVLRKYKSMRLWLFLSRPELIKTWIIKLPRNKITYRILGSRKMKITTWVKQYHHNSRVIRTP